MFWWTIKHYKFLYHFRHCFFIYLIKHFSLFLLGNVFVLSKYTQLYSFAVLVFNVFTGIYLIPINFIIAFGPSNFNEIIIVISLFYLGFMILLRTIRGIFIVSNLISDRIFQIFIYLCAMEIAPVLILAKTVIKWGLYN
ncbi:MAG: DUF4271 domain-containing protein [Saprospiraceae bacterium]|nr:DUF4271 domain-containing protein [Saprospiraceae bacterium]